MANFQYDPDEQEDGEEGGGFYYSNSSASIFVIDCSPPMFNKMADIDDIPFIFALKCVHATVMRKIISNKQDYIAVIFYNTKNSRSYNEEVNFPNIYVLQNLNKSGAERVLELERFFKGAATAKFFESRYGTSNDASLHDVFWMCRKILRESIQMVTTVISRNLIRSSKRSIFACLMHYRLLHWPSSVELPEDGLWRSPRCIGKSKLFDQCVLLFSCCDYPCSVDSDKFRQIKQGVNDLKEADIALEILPIGKDFDLSKFYKELIQDDENSLLAESLNNPSSRFDDLLEKVRAIDHQHRSTGKVNFTLGGRMEMAVAFYTYISEVRLPIKSKLYKLTNEEVKIMRKEYREDSGELLMPSDYAKYQIYGNRKIKFTVDEVKSLSKIYEPGMTLLGFKPISDIKPYFHVRPANFIFPDEKSISGSTKMFAALLDRCLARKVAPLVRVVPRKGAEVSWAALIPQAEKIEEGIQALPPGFHVWHLPFADDFRNIELQNTTQASQDQVEGAKAVIKRLHFKYHPSSFDNPKLQTHWRNLEALALNRDELEPIVDYTVPDYERMRKKASAEFSTFKDLVFPAEYDPLKAPKKIASKPQSSPPPKRPKLDNFSVEDLAKEKKVEKLNMEQLKCWLQQRGVKISGKKKAQLVQDVYDELKVA